MNKFRDELMAIFELMASATELHNTYLSIFETITPDDFFQCKEHYTNLEGSGPNERDCDVSNSMEATVLEKLGAVLIKSMDTVIVMPTDAFTLPVRKDPYEYLKDKIDILRNSNSIQECMSNIEEYYKALLN